MSTRYCPTCGGPLWPHHEDRTVAGWWDTAIDDCRLCWLMFPGGEEGFDVADSVEAMLDRVDQRLDDVALWRQRIAEANTSSATTASSLFLPVGARDWTVTTAAEGDAARLDVWLEHAPALAEMGRPDHGGSSMWALFPSAGFVEPSDAFTDWLDQGAPHAV